MGKYKVVSQDKKMPAQKNMQSIVKKRRKKKSNKESLNSLHKNDLKKLNALCEAAKSTFTSAEDGKKRKKHSSKNEFAAEKIPKYPKNDSKTAKVSQKVQSDKDNKIKYKKGNKQKQDIDCTSHVAEANVSIVKRDKKAQKPMCAKKPINFKNSQVKIQNIKKMNERMIKLISTKAETQQKKPVKILKINKHKINLNRLEEILRGESQTKQVVQPLTLRDRMMAQLRASRFRFINETLYNNKSSQSKKYFKEDPDAFQAYHNGYNQQLEQWPMNPLDIIISSIKKMY